MLSTEAINLELDMNAAFNAAMHSNAVCFKLKTMNLIVVDAGQLPCLIDLSPRDVAEPIETVSFCRDQH